MIILDLNQVMYSNVAAHSNFSSPEENSEGLYRHMLLNTVRSINRRFKNGYGELVIASDSRSWRNDVFPYYKWRRRQKRLEQSGPVDWRRVSEMMDVIRQELRDFLPWRVVEAEGAEGDDVIQALVEAHSEGHEENFFGGSDAEPILIVSGDKDFKQLQRYPNVRQYDPVHKRDMSTNDARTELLTLIAKGDGVDDVPNCLSADDVFVRKIRQTTMTGKRLEGFLKTPVEFPEGFDTDVHRSYWSRNQTLVDLSFCPRRIQDACLESYDSQRDKKVGPLLQYFMAKQLKNLTESMNDFKR